MIGAMLTLALLQHPSGRSQAPPRPVQGRDTTAGRPCKIVVDTVGHYGRQVEVRPGETNLFAGGGVRGHCQGTASTITADSLAWYAGEGRLDLLGGVQIRDSAMSLDAVTVNYFVRQERLDAHKNVVAVSRANGSVLRGPNLVYYRVVRGVRDTMEMYASSRPTIEYRSVGDSGEPYIIVGDRVRTKGNDRMWAGGSVTIDRSDFAASADSMMRDEAAGRSVLVGKPRVQGKGPRGYVLTGRRIELGLNGREVRVIKALGAGSATSTDWHLTADTIHFLMERRKLQRAFAWGDSTRPRAVSTRHTIEADSLALDAPDEVLTEARAFGHALSTSQGDTTGDPSAGRNWMTGDTITAHWATAPTRSTATKTTATQLQHLVARGSARALTHMRNAHDSTVSAPSLNYSRGTVIDVTFRGDSIRQVLVTGRADGIELEPVPPPPPPTDSTKRAKPATRPPASSPPPSPRRGRS
ncbi:MAG TPA: hypothetical protein VLV16_15020 [Gemmatimonadales bacterium]|nr:hypothetical protein [Gemmatimonadales bacterium]